MDSNYSFDSEGKPKPKPPRRVRVIRGFTGYEEDVKLEHFPGQVFDLAEPHASFEISIGRVVEVSASTPLRDADPPPESTGPNPADEDARDREAIARLQQRLRIA